jgi:Heterokaryon incompatibility protein (HET)
VIESERVPRLSGMPLKRMAATDTSSQGAMRTALGWIAMCEMFHQSCQMNPVDSRPPSRLLSIGEIEDEHLRLIEPGDHVAWVCLTHRWGGKVPACLTMRSNYQEQLDCIAWEKLPRTFQDAVSFTRRLGHQYIWIDTICIVQDDDEDWRRESSRMADYYSGAVLTIAATNSLDCDSGLFNQVPVPSIRIQFSGDLQSTIYIRRKLTHRLQRYEGTRQLDELPTLHRAWVYQERLLSRRILHFSNQELQWECRENSECDCGFTKPTEVDPKIDQQRITRLRQNRPTFDRLHLLNRWMRVVEEYSPLQLTYSRDKLPALSGLAKVFAALFGIGESDYYAGLWHTHILPETLFHDNGMLWAKRPEEPLSIRPKPWRSPSWTWASVEGGVVHPWQRALTWETSISFISNLFIQTKPVSNVDATGEVQAAHLSLRGPVVDAMLIYPSSEAPARFSHEFLLHTHVQGGSVEKLFIDYAIHDKSDEEHYVADGEKVKVLRVCHLQAEPRVISLVLRELEEGSGMYERIGIAEELSPRETDPESTQDRWPLHQGEVQNITIL